MAFKVILTSHFRKDLKRIAKKHRLIIADISQLINTLSENPTQGTNLGHNIYKIRLSISGTAQGKSGGARVITSKNNKALLSEGLVLIQNRLLFGFLPPVATIADVRVMLETPLKKIVEIHRLCVSDHLFQLCPRPDYPFVFLFCFSILYHIIRFILQTIIQTSFYFYYTNPTTHPREYKAAGRSSWMRYCQPGCTGTPYSGGGPATHRPPQSSGTASVVRPLHLLSAVSANLLA